MVESHQLSTCAVLALMCSSAFGLPYVTSPDPRMIKNVLWSKYLPRPDEKAYASWYNSSELAWMSENELPYVSPLSQVDIFFCTKPIFTVIGETTGMS